MFKLKKGPLKHTVYSLEEAELYAQAGWTLMSDNEQDVHKENKSATKKKEVKENDNEVKDEQNDTISNTIEK